MSLEGWEVTGKSMVEFYGIPFEDIPEARWFFFYSKNAVRFFEQYSSTDSDQLMREYLFAAIGPGTGAAISALGWTPSFIGSGHPEEVGQLFSKLVNGALVVFVGAKYSRNSIQPIVAKTTRTRFLAVYENVMNPFDFKATFDALVFTSPLNVESFLQKQDIQCSQLVVAIGRTTAQALRDRGVKKVKVAEAHTEEAMANCLLKP